MTRLNDEHLKVIHDLENGYKSLANVPEQNEKLQYLRNTLYPGNYHRDHRKNRVVDFDKIKSMSLEGYAPEEIAKAVDLEPAYIRRRLKAASIIPEPWFSYKLTNKIISKSFYFTNRRLIEKLVGKSYRWLTDNENHTEIIFETVHTSRAHIGDGIPILNDRDIKKNKEPFPFDKKL